MKKIIFALLMPCLVQAQITMPISIAGSELTWEGRPLVGSGHTGIIRFASGSLTADENGKMMKGEFVLDMRSIENTDIEEEQSRKDLEDHLKSDDFFSVDKFPTATLSLVSVTPSFIFPPKQDQYIVTGRLTIKGITHSISFPATVTDEKGEISAVARIIMDRTRWGVNYQSKSIFASLKDGIISDEITILVHLKFDGC